jgi:ABC-type transport system involved in multi-copper enzyme maturation permease subunit
MRQLIALEWRLLLRERIALLLLGVYLVLLALAVANGRATIDAAVQAHTQATAQAADAKAAFAARLSKPMAPADAVLMPVRVRMPITAPVPLLADFTAGRQKFEASAATAGLRSRAEGLFRQQRLDNPALLARGVLDLSFAALLVAPLLLVALGAGLFAADRDSSIARLVLVQGGSAGRMLLARSIPRLALVAGPLVLAAGILLLLGPALPGRTGAALLWLLMALLLLAFWWAVILFANAFRIGGQTAALALIGLWALLTLVVPPALSTLATVLHPAPSRFAEIAASRAAEVAATQAWDNDHAAQATDEAARRAESLRKGLAIGAAMDTAVAPIARDFAQAMADQQSLVRKLSWVSPPMVAGLALEDVAGTGAAQFAQFRAAATDYLGTLKTDLGRYVLAGQPMDAAALADVPRFAFVPARAVPWGALLWLAALAAGFGIAAVRLLRRPLFG